MKKSYKQMRRDGWKLKYKAVCMDYVILVRENLAIIYYRKEKVFGPTYRYKRG